MLLFLLLFLFLISFGHNIFVDVESNVESSVYMFDIACAKYAFACGLLIWKNIQAKKKHFNTFYSTESWKLLIML